MLSLNQTKAEKEANAMRLGLLAHRHKEFSEDNQALVLTMPSLGQINLDSILVNCKGDKYFVITSYSIHYTKLYERDANTVPMTFTYL